MINASKQRIDELLLVIRPQLISIANGATPYFDENDKVKVDLATCGSCDMTWNDALGTGRTPAPSARCPYEYIHAELAELKRLSPSTFQETQRRIGDRKDHSQ
jgi:hypothetical protein